MIQLVFSEIEYALEIGDAFNLVIENSKLFYSFLRKIYNYDTDIRISIDNKILDNKKSYIFINDICNIEFNKKFLTTFYTIVNNEYKSNPLIDKQLIELSTKIVELLELIRYDLPIDVEYSDVVTLKDILSLCNFTIINDSNNLLNQILIFIKINKIINDYKIIFIPFIDSFLTIDEINLLIDECKFLGISLFVLNSKDNKEILFDKLIIDYDLCLI